MTSDNVTITGTTTTVVNKTADLLVQAALTTPPPPAWTLPTGKTVSMTPMLNLGGGIIAISDLQAVEHVGNCAFTFTATKGLLRVIDKTGTTPALTGNGTVKIQGNDTIANINALLATLVFTPTTIGAGNINLDFWDQNGVRANVNLPITITP